MDVTPTDPALNSTVTVTVQVRATGQDPLTDGQVWIDAKYPSGKVTTKKTVGILVEPGATVPIVQLRGPLPETGTWHFFASLRDDSGSQIAEGPSGGVTATVPVPDNPRTTMDPILKKAATYKYCSSCQDAACLLKVGCGSCWAMSDYLCQEFSKAHIHSRVVQYDSGVASNHRSVQYYDNGWMDVPYRDYNFDTNFRNTVSKPGMFVQAQCY